MKKSSSGFTLIEVMVATAVLLIMVVMIGSLFRQSSSAWDAGYARSEGGMIVRGVVGFVTRDLNAAIDARPFEVGLDEPIEISNSSLSFVRMGALEDKDDRGPHLVTYSFGSRVTRTDSRLVYSSKTWRKVDTISSVLYEGPGSGSGTTSSYSAGFSIEKIIAPDTGMLYDGEPMKRGWEEDGWSENPDQADSFKHNVAWEEIIGVKIRLTLTRTGQFSGLTVLSLGADGVMNDSSDSKGDDIIIQ